MKSLILLLYRTYHGILRLSLRKIGRKWSVSLSVDKRLI